MFTFYILVSMKEIALLTYLTEHRQLFGKVHHSGNGGGDNFCKLTEGFNVHFAPFGCIYDRCLTNVLRLKRQEVEGGHGSVHVSMSNRDRLLKDFKTQGATEIGCTLYSAVLSSIGHWLKVVCYLGRRVQFRCS